jgi:hypothetical protein
MLVITNEEGTAEKRFTFNGYQGFEGDQITKDEFQQFAIETLFNEYKIRDIDVSRNLDNNLKEINFYINSTQDMIGLIVRPTEYSFDEDFSKIISKANENNLTLRLALAHFTTFKDRGFDWEKVKIGENGFRKGIFPIYLIRFEFISLIPDNYPLSTEILGHNELVEIFAEAWNSLSTEKITKYLDTNFHYYSDWVFDILPSRKEYIKYLNGKFNTLKENNLQTEFKLVANDKNETALLFNQNGEKALLYIKTENGRIMMAHMTAYSDKKEEHVIEPVEDKQKINWFKNIFKRNKST